MPERKKLEDSMREAICTKYDMGKTPVKISEELDLKYRTVASVILLYKTTGRIYSDFKKCGRKKKLDTVQTEFIKSKIDEDVSITLSELKMKVNDEFSLNCSVSTINRAIDSFNYTFKKLQLVPIARNIESNLTVRKHYAADFMNISHEDIIYLDETGMNCSMRKSHGRSIIGSTPRKEVRSIRSKNFSISAAMTKNEIFIFEIIQQAYNRDKYYIFIEKVIAKLFSKGKKNQIFICDNVAFHKVEEIKRLIETAGHKLLFLPPYSPQLNPIEEVFSKWKNIVKAANCTTTEELVNVIESSHLLITLQDCQNYITHMQSYIAKALSGEIF